MLGQRRRQWANFKPMFSCYILFAGNLVFFIQHQGEWSRHSAISKGLLT